ncbi:radical SAM protein [Pseudothermotoga thermarum]|uniref:Radical SAM domain protein n=1 Tax=Pseudothermotoga thermarum DSM 5069 TaxID=688269 RepID=F7YTW7_9THEM|nr:radical SAM protein [Pseudothermotoga thermarum]AEH51416.1 Radical SAM domain protein [Pseudothermotoga thermarum DSM 5069]
MSSRPDFQILKNRLEKLLEKLKNCDLCPRNCKVNRLEGEIGACQIGAKVVVASYGPHFGEESFLVGYGGSGTIFFSGCNLKCVFCQNWTISQTCEGKEVELEKVMLFLQKIGCHNINLVTPTHQVPMIFEALIKAFQLGLKIPIVYNCGGYESVETLKLLEGVIDIYMPDFKYGDDEMALKYSGVHNYVEVAKTALEEMFRQVGPLRIENGVAVKGVFVRHLVLPNDLANSEKVFKIIADVSKDIPVNVMAQYYPTYKASRYPELSRRIYQSEYYKAVELAKKYGLTVVQ